MRRVFYYLLISLLFFLNPHFSYAQTLSSNVYYWNTSTIPTYLNGLEKIVEISNGQFHSLALKSDGTIWAWGRNSDGQLGDGTTVDKISPVQVKESSGIGILSNVVSISAGHRYSMALKNDGTVWVWGYNSFGTRGTGIGIGENLAPPLLFPTQVKKSSSTILNDIIEIAAGENHSLALHSDGTVSSWGSNSLGQLGIGCSSSVSNPSCSNRFFANKIPNFGNIRSITAGRNHNLALGNDFNVWGWGRAQEGQLGSSSNGSQQINSPTLIPGINNILAISAKFNSSTALSKEGYVYEWGSRGLSNQLGPDPRQVQNLSNVIDIGSGQLLSFAVRDNGTVWQWKGDNIVAQQVVELSNIIKVEGGMSTPNLAIEEFNPTPPTPTPFLDLPLNYLSYGKTFDEVALNPSSWFDHEFPLQNTACCSPTAVNFAGTKDNFYKSHNGYDYAANVGLELNEPVLAAASGFASFIPESGSGGLGNLIKIDHGNGYQTWYGHLQPTDLLPFIENSESVFVEKGEIIGRVGKTGNVTGPHLHFTVVKDSNENENFNDDYPFGLVDPLGWEGEYNDPWENWEQNGRFGTKSYNLFIENIPPEPVEIPPIGGQITFDNLIVNIPANAYSGTISVEFKKGPFTRAGEKLKGILPSVILNAFNSFNNKVSQFAEPIEIVFDYSGIDLSNFDQSTLSVYYYDNELEEWVKLPTTINTDTKTASTTTNHFSLFSLMGDQLDLISPTTIVQLNGDESEENWFRSDVTVELNASDNENGIGVMGTIYSYNNGIWDNYTNPLLVVDEGTHALSFMSYDNVGNEEEIKTAEFYIDKTMPEVSVSTDKTVLWPPNGKLIPVKVNGTASDDNLNKSWVVIKDEYNEMLPIITSFGETIFLKSSRNGNDIDGRTYEVKAFAEDKAGNISSSTAQIIVPHDENNTNQNLPWLQF